MSINLEINQAQLASSKECETKLHYMPVSIIGDGPAEVDMYFNNYTAKEDGVLKNTFRGFPLLGCEFPLPDSYRGLILQETDTPLDENANRVFKLSDSFDKFNYWNYDKIPSKADAFKQMWDVLSVADAMSADISLDDIKKKMEQKANEDVKVKPES